MKVVIVGAGIGGLTLGVALRQRGHEVQVLEKRAEFSDEGAGVVLGPHVLAAVRLLGLDVAIEAEGRVVPAMNITDQRGRVLTRSSYRVTNLRAPGIAIHRSRLHRLLRQRFDGEVVLGVEPSELSFGERPSLHFGDRTLECDLIVGADGIRSHVRRALAPSFETRYSGTTCFRYVVDQQWTDEVFEQWGPGKRVGVVPLGHGQTYVFLTLKLAEYERLRRPRAEWILKQSYTLGRIAQLESAPLRFLRDWAVRLTPAAVNARALRRIIADMPGVPIDRQLAAGR